MPGAVARSNGATGPAPVTSFFGPIPDRFNLLQPAHPPAQQDKQFPANNINQFTIFNTIYTGGPNADTTSLGAFTTAPDGSNTAQKVVETTSNSLHALTASAGVAEIAAYLYPIRLAVFAKAAERTRIVLKIAQTSSPFAYCQTVFDLAGGRVGVPGFANFTGSGLDLAPIQDIILPFGDGWYLCMTDINCNAGSIAPGMMAWFELDSGSGLAATSDSYTGNGTSGVYTWRSNCMPPTAYGMSGQRVFFEDFTNPTLSQIDLGNTRAPGFSWYIYNTWPGFRSGLSPGAPGLPNDTSDPTSFEWSAPSYLKINKRDLGFNVLGINTACWDGGTGYIGTAYQLSNRLIEVRVKWDDPGDTSPLAAWATVVNDICTHPKFPADGNAAFPYRELDFIERGGAIGINGDPQCTFSSGSYVSNNGGAQDFAAIIQSNQIGAHKWNPTIPYQGTIPPADVLVHYNGVVYQCITSAGANHQPDISPAVWQTPPNAATNLPANPADIYQYDYNEFNTYSVIWLEETPTSPGYSMTFFNGRHCRAVIGRGSFFTYDSIRKTFDASQNLRVMERQLNVIWLESYWPNTYWDWISLTE